jgi:hypothetical protein
MSQNTPKVKTVDITPSWEGMVNVAMLFIENGGSTRSEGIAILRNIGKLADKYVALHKDGPPIEELLEDPLQRKLAAAFALGLFDNMTPEFENAAIDAAYKMGRDLITRVNDGEV